MATSSLQLHVPLLSLAILAFSLLVLTCGRCAAREEPGERPAGTYLPLWEWRFIEGLAVFLTVAVLVALLVCVCRRGKGGAVAAVEGSREWSRATAGPPKSDHYMSINATMVRSPPTTPDARPRSSVSPDSRRLPPSLKKLLWMLLAVPVPADELAAQHSWPPVEQPEKDAVITDPFSPCSRASWVRVGPKKLGYERLEIATNHFDTNSQMGKPVRQWVMYKGTNFVADEGLPAVVVIKRFHEIISTERRERMLDDLSRMTTLQHKNVVSLLGYSFGEDRFHLVYSYMSNGSLEKCLFREPDGDGTGLIWRLRYSIVNDVARALYHLHVTNVPHGSIKASNVMLEQDFTAQLHEHFGYQPDQSNTPCGSLEADMLEFGVLILQLVCGPGQGSPTDLVDWVWTLHGKSRLLEAVDPAARGDGFDSAQATKLLLLALSCTYPDPAVRLTINEVREILSDQEPLPEVPPCIPI